MNGVLGGGQNICMKTCLAKILKLREVLGYSLVVAHVSMLMARWINLAASLWASRTCKAHRLCIKRTRLGPSV